MATVPSGVPVPDKIARVVIADPDVVSTGDGLFTEGPAQTWRIGHARAE